jgi:hypothetical protein
LSSRCSWTRWPTRRGWRHSLSGIHEDRAPTHGYEPTREAAQGGIREELATGMIEHLGIKMPWTHLDIFASACRPASVIRTRTTPVCRPSATMRSRFVVASPALTSSIIMSIENPCARRIALV